MADHIVVFDGSSRLIGNTVRVRVDDASAFTLYGRVLTGEGVGAAVAFTPDAARAAAEPEDAPAYPAPLDFAPPAEKRIGLPLA
jgi:tRNA-2-methylthio-N6-dimethylallyladenosine synthase